MWPKTVRELLVDVSELVSGLLKIEAVAVEVEHWSTTLASHVLRSALPCDASLKARRSADNDTHVYMPHSLRKGTEDGCKRK